jgi:RNA polymerase sigma factor (sigma-70 family)
MIVFPFASGDPVPIDERIIALLRERLVRFGQSKVGREVAEDLTHDTLMLLPEKYPRVERISDLLPLAMRVMQLKMMDYKRGQFRRHEHTRQDPEDLDLADLGLRPDEILEAKEFAAHMAAAMARLGPKCREILRFRMEGLTTGQIQERLANISAETVNMRVFHCRQRLRQLMELPWKGER